MPRAAVNRLLIVLGAAALILVITSWVASVRGAVTELWLVQVTFPGLDSGGDASPYEPIGRVEVTANGGVFVGCAWPVEVRVGQGEIRLYAPPLGYAASGPKEQIRVEATGELRRLGQMRVKITPLGGPVPGLQDPR